MNLHGGRFDRPPAVDTNLDGRLRAAGKALRESSITQVDAATGLREILHTSRLAGDDLADPPQEPTAASPPHRSTAGRLFRSPQRLALAVNLLLVLVLGVLIVRVATYERQPAGTTTSTVSTAVTTTSTASAAVVAPQPTVPFKVKVKVPQACVEAADLADQVISRLDQNQRDQRLFLALRDYTIASQACRREAAS
jgi:hypothetical protein